MLEFWRSTIGKKVFVAVSGTILIAYLIVHMIGNLNSLWGPGAEIARVDEYGEWLRAFGEPLIPHETLVWGVRAVLLAAITVHIVGVVQLNARNRAARPEGFPARRIGRSFESRLMMVSGVLLLAFIVFHVLQFTTLTIDVTPLAAGAIYANLYNAFQEWYLVAIYLVALLLLGMHLRHAIWSLTQTLGLDSPERNRAIRMSANGLTVVLVLGFALIPVAFAAGWLAAPATETIASNSDFTTGGSR